MICSVDGCDKPVFGRGFCRAHYNRFQRHGDPLAGRISPDPSRICSISACGKPVVARGLCSGHYKRLRRYGDPLAGDTPKGAALAFFETVVLPYDGDDCLIWPFTRDNQGYAQLRSKGRTIRISRSVCAHAHGPSPTPKHEAAHICGQGHMGCVASSHLIWKTPKENCADRVVHGTANRGEKCGTSKLTESDVREIRNLLGTMSQSAIAKKYGVCQQTIGYIKTGKRWQHLREGWQHAVRKE